jgi:hypothetical protein
LRERDFELNVYLNNTSIINNLKNIEKIIHKLYKSVVVGSGYHSPIQVPLRKWYWRDVEGKIRFCLRVGNKKLELKKGKTNIVVGDDRQLPSVIEKCISAAEEGELDGVIGILVN